MSKYKVGDRVAVYLQGRIVGSVTHINGEFLEVKTGLIYGWYHQKQCRRLVKKPRRRIWVHRDETENFFTTQQPVSNIIHEFTEFVEVRRKKK